MYKKKQEPCEAYTLKERGFEEVGCKLTDSRMRTKNPAITDVTDSAQALRSTKSCSQKMKHRHNNVDSTPARTQIICIKITVTE
jgi:hypothetical protein